MRRSGRTHRMLLEAVNSVKRYNIIVGSTHEYATGDLLRRFTDMLPGCKPDPYVRGCVVDTDGRKFLFTSVQEPEEITLRTRGLRDCNVLWDHAFWDRWRLRGGTHAPS